MNWKKLKKKLNVPDVSQDELSCFKLKTPLKNHIFTHY